MARRKRENAQRLHRAVEALPVHTKLGMLRGINSSRITVGAYTDKRGGVCPMLAAHRNGGRTDFGTFARAWDGYTNAKRARRASAREVRTLRGYLELSLVRDGVPPSAWTDAAGATPARPLEYRPLAEEVRAVKRLRRRLAAEDARRQDITVEELIARSHAALEQHRTERRAAELLSRPRADSSASERR